MRKLLKEECIATEGLNITAAGPNDTFAKANDTAAISCASVQSGTGVILCLGLIE